MQSIRPCVSNLRRSWPIRCWIGISVELHAPRIFGISSKRFYRRDRNTVSSVIWSPWSCHSTLVATRWYQVTDSIVLRMQLAMNRILVIRPGSVEGTYIRDFLCVVSEQMGWKVRWRWGEYPAPSLGSGLVSSTANCFPKDKGTMPLVNGSVSEVPMSINTVIFEIVPVISDSVASRVWRLSDGRPYIPYQELIPCLCERVPTGELCCLLGR